MQKEVNPYLSGFKNEFERQTLKKCVKVFLVKIFIESDEMKI